MVDALIIGAGVAGAACARALARRGVTVTVCDPGPLPGAASPASAGMLAAQIEPDDALLTLGVRARDLYDPLAAELRDTTGIDIGLWRSGILSVAFDDARADHLQAEVARQRQAGLRCDWLAGDDVRHEWPGVAPECSGALFSPEDGALDPDALRRALIADARRLGVTMRTTSVTGIQHAGGRATGVTTGDGPLKAAHVVLAAGAWSAGLAGLPRPVPVEPVRGQLAELPWPPDAPHTIAFDGHRYAVARGDSAIVGSTMERVGFDPRVTAEGLDQLRATVTRLLPWLADRPFARTRAGLRPASPDGRALVGPDPEVAGLWYATGHGRTGILLAAVTGEIVGDLVERGESDIDWAPLTPDRSFSSEPA